MCWEIVADLMNENSNPGRTGLALVFRVNTEWPFLSEVFLSFVLYFSYDTYWWRSYFALYVAFLEPWQ